MTERDAQPIDLSADDIRAKARGLKAAGEVTRRLRREVATEPIGKLDTDSVVPAPISAKEMAAIRRTGAPTGAVAARLQRAAKKDPTFDQQRAYSRKLSPEQPPPRHRRNK